MTYAEFRRLSRQGDVIPVSCELPADLETPVSVFLKVGRAKSEAFLLESVELGEKLGRFSLIGTNPELVLEYRAGTAFLTRAGKGRTLKLTGDLLPIVQALMKRYRFAADPSLPSLVGGFVGYIGYELVEQFEELKLKKKKGLGVPDSVLFFPQNLIAFDHIKRRMKLIHLAIVNGSRRIAYEKALRELNRMKRELARGKMARSKRGSQTAGGKLVSHVSRRRFEQMVKRAKEYIRAGDAIQIVLSQRFDLGRIPDDFLLYRALRSLNPSPYMFYFRYKKFSLIGSSPEMLVKKTARSIELKPIAGTRPRGDTPEQDEAYEKALRSSPKELAEHLMLVDLGRNDLGRVSESKSVQVTNFARIERYSHVMHLVSDIEAVLKKGKSSFDLLRAAFPAGTVTGAPKIRAMQIIDELEPDRRGPYAGSLGYFSLAGDMDMCITIRTIVVTGGRAYVQAGAGIVNDSNPAKEYQETINKARALSEAARMCRQGVL